MANFLVWCVWVVAAFVCVASALGVVSFRNPFYSALATHTNAATTQTHQTRKFAIYECDL